jgi:hypothetical protein
MKRARSTGKRHLESARTFRCFCFWLCRVSDDVGTAHCAVPGALKATLEEYACIVLQYLFEELQRMDVIGRDAGRAGNQAAQDRLEGMSAKPTATDDVFAQGAPVSVEHDGAVPAMLQRDDECPSDRDVACDGLLAALPVQDHRVGDDAVQAAWRGDVDRLPAVVGRAAAYFQGFASC